MKLHTVFSSRAASILSILLLASLLLPFNGVLAQNETGNASSGAPALVRIDLDTTDALQTLAAAGLTVYDQAVFSAAGGSILAAASPAEQQKLASAGYDLQILDADSRGASYAWITGDESALQKALTYATLLERSDSQALVRLNSSQPALETLPLHMRLLMPRSLILPKGHVSSIPPDIQYDTRVQAMIDQVTSTAVNDYDGGLSGEWPVIIGGQSYTIATRYSHAVEPMEKATQYAYEHFQALGLASQYHYYDLGGGEQRRNVIGEQPGLVQPERIFLVTAHLDSTSGDPYNLAPGADDNASGSVAVLIASDILSQYDFGCTIRYVLFTGEEQGLVGSSYYAQDVHNNNEQIEAVLNLDMIAYNSDSYPIIDLHSRSAIPDSVALSNLVADVVGTYSLPLTPNSLVDNYLGNYSDNASFWDYDYAAILGIEDNDDFTPYYHTTSDQLETLNLDYFTAYVKAAVGSMGHLGCLGQSGLEGIVTDQFNGNPIPNAHLVVQAPGGQTWTVDTAANGSYSLPLEPDTYTVIVSATGYLPTSIPNVVVVENEVTTLDTPLERCLALQDVDFTHSPLMPLLGEPAFFTMTYSTGTPPTGAAWDFGDGELGSGLVVTHTYTISDILTVKMTAANCDGPLSVSKEIFVGGIPGMQASAAQIQVSQFGGEKTSQILTLYNAGSLHNAWSLAENPSVPWMSQTLNSGTLQPGQSVDIQVSLAAPQTPGNYTSALLVTSEDPLQPVISIPVTLTVMPCLAISQLDYTYAPVDPVVGEIVTFTASAGGSSPLSYTWYFADGSSAQGEVVTHIFAEGRSYPVTVTANNCFGPAYLTKQVVVASPAAPALSYTAGAMQDTLLAGQVISHTLTIQNTGGAPLVWGLSADPAAAWLSIETAGGMLAAGESVDVILWMTAPQSAGSYAATLLLTSNDPAHLQIELPVSIEVETPEQPVFRLFVPAVFQTNSGR